MPISDLALLFTFNVCKWLYMQLHKNMFTPPMAGRFYVSSDAKWAIPFRKDNPHMDDFSMSVLRDIDMDSKSTVNHSSVIASTNSLHHT